MIKKNMNMNISHIYGTCLRQNIIADICLWVDLVEDGFNHSSKA